MLPLAATEPAASVGNEDSKTGATVSLTKTSSALIIKLDRIVAVTSIADPCFGPFMFGNHLK
ncbi:hypothetical protein D3C87_960370 [compost metagenome]